jgi:tubulin monoglycylase TTLL3/8
MHLTNNSIQKYNKNAVIDESMWEMKTFVDLIGEEKWRAVQEKMKSIIVWSIKSCEGSVTGKKGFFEMVGYDFMIDENLNPWIIEINMSPSMDHSTPVTKKLVKMVQRDMANLITAPPKKK